MRENLKPVYSRSVVEFVAVANEFCKYVERADELQGGDLLKILQRILPMMYIKASLLPAVQPYFDDGNEKFVTEARWEQARALLCRKFGTADDYIEVFDIRAAEEGSALVASISENMADIYQDIKDFLLLYQTGSQEVMNDAVWECRLNFESLWGQKLVNSLRAIHSFIYSGEEIQAVEKEKDGNGNKRV
ncbi:MAG: DUF5063 domain-containing protein [Bacteroidales bacterium]|jgi:hypothetical protein|nr:DUF5063 domain-containing protein [Bacteroidales bacterium]